MGKHSQRPISISVHIKVTIETECRTLLTVVQMTYCKYQVSVLVLLPIWKASLSVNGIVKLLKDLNPHKAAGPIQLKPLVLQKLRDVIAPVLQVIFQRSLGTGKVPKDWSTAFVLYLSSFQKRRHQPCIKLQAYFIDQQSM